MSGLLAGKVWQSNLSPDLKPLAAALADIANDDGTSIYPSVAYMCWLLGRTKRAVQNQLRLLKETKVLEIEKEGGGRVTTHYRLVEDNLPKRQAWKNRAGNNTSATVSPVKSSTPVKSKHGRSSSQTAAQPTAPNPSLEPPANHRGRNRAVLASVSRFDGGKASDHRFPHNPITQMNFFADHSETVTLKTAKTKMETAKEILVAKGHESDLVEVALLRVADLAGAKKQVPRSVHYFVAAVETNLSDELESDSCRRIAADRRERGIAINAPLEPTEKHDGSKIAFVQDVVEEASRSKRRASEVLAQRLRRQG